MTFITSKSRGVSFEGEMDDCSVRALSNCTGMSYKDSHHLHHTFGRKDLGITTERTLVKTYKYAGLVFVGAFGVTKSARAFKFLLGGSKNPGMNLKNALKKFPKGRFIFGIRDHVFAVVDGEILDTRRNRENSYVSEVWKYPEN